MVCCRRVLAKLTGFYTIAIFFLCSSNAFKVPIYSPCHNIATKYGSVCLCTESYCDEFAAEGTLPLAAGEFAVYTSSASGERFHLQTGKFSKPKIATHFSGDPLTLKVDRNTTFQKIMGFGAAFTDAASINILNVSSTLQAKLLNSYFGSVGIEYSIGRVPMASCDFSTREYSYDDVADDYDLVNFTLVKEDLDYKIPVLLQALKISKRNISIFGSPWSAPAWMKTNGKMTGFGELKGTPGDKIHKTWALYFAKFIEAYKEKGIDIWGVTVQNEPSDGFLPGFSFQCMQFTKEDERDFIKKDLGPMLAQRSHNNVKIMMLDDQRPFLLSWVDVILSDPEAAKYVAGIGVHWYWDSISAASDLTQAHSKFPNHFILATEACTGSFITSHPRGVALGSWERGQQYSVDIIQDLNNWVVGWTDWNLALNLEGGPNWVKNYVDSPIIVDAEHKAFYKQPMFYHLGHFSKFIAPGSQRISVTATSPNPLQFTGFSTNEDTTVVVVLNANKEKVTFAINDPKFGSISTSIGGSSIQTYIW